MILVVKGRTVTPITYFKWNQEETVEVGTILDVNLDEMLANIDDVAFSIDITEFTVLHPN